MKLVIQPISKFMELMEEDSDRAVHTNMILKKKISKIKK